MKTQAHTYVLRSTRSASSNSPSTSDADTGVSRDHKDLPPTFDSQAPLVEVAGEQYRASLGEAEYLVWAAEDCHLTGDARFWWSRNTPGKIKFGWDGTLQRWAPLRGSPPTLLGRLVEPEVYTLAPRPKGLSLGQTVDFFRAGANPGDESHTLTVVVVPDGDIDSGSVDFPALGSPEGVLEQTTGKLLLSQSAFQSLQGQPLWYIFPEFPRNADGDLGPLGGELFMAPIPMPWENPLLRIGSRKHLKAIGYPDDTSLDNATLSPGEAGWSWSSGRLRFHPDDVERADPDSPLFKRAFLEARVYYDGVASSTEPIPLPDPVEMVEQGGSLYVPLANPLPHPGTSGVLYVPDGSGTIPNASQSPGTRPNGSGLVRSLGGLGDLLVWASDGDQTHVFDSVKVVEFESELPPLSFRVPENTVYIALESGAAGSRVQYRQAGLEGHTLRLRQCHVTPAYHTSEPRIFSKNQGPFEFEGGESLFFFMEGTPYTWVAPAGTQTAEQVASALNSLLPSGSSASAFRGHVVLESSGSVEIGFGPTAALEDRDFSGAHILGFVPGWRAEGVSSWLPDNGSSVLLYRSPDSQQEDFRATRQVEDRILTESVGQSPLFLLPHSPLQDLPGFGPNSYFRVINGSNERLMEDLVDVVYDFPNRRFGWVDTVRATVEVRRETDTLSLGRTSLVAKTMDARVIPGNGLRVSEDGSTWVSQVPQEDYLVPGGGAPGAVNLVDRIGASILSGAGANTVAPDILEDPNADFSDVAPGMLLHVLSGPNRGLYRISDIPNNTQVQITPGVLETVPSQAWEILSGFEEHSFDPAVVADVQYTPFNHLSEETFQVSLWSHAGSVGDPLFCDATLALQSERPIHLAVGDDTLDLRVLRRGVLLGSLSQGLSLPDSGDVHVVTGAFRVRVGAVTYTPTSATWVDEDPPPSGDVVEYRSDGALRFGEQVLETLGGATVHYDEVFLLPADIPEGQALLDADSGQLILSLDDSTAYVGQDVFFVERLISEAQRDVFLSPLSGSFFINLPVREGQRVHAKYFQADVAGDRVGGQVTEFLPSIVKLEEASRDSALTYTFNPLGRTLAPVTPQVWVAGELQNYGGLQQVSIQGNTLIFNRSIPVEALVEVSYAVLEATGGEQAYRATRHPIWRPPFFLEEGQESFVLEGERSDVVEGHILRLGAFPFYIESTSFDGANTTVTIHPTPTQGVGSRAPGSDVISLITNVNVRDNTGLMLSVPAGFEEVSKGSSSVMIEGDATSLVVPGHLVEIGGDPYLVAGVALVEGRRTEISLTTSARRTYRDDQDGLRLSARPIYPPRPTTFLPTGPLLEEERYEVVLLPGGERGRILVEDRDYSLDSGDGSLALVSPLGSSDVLLFHRTRTRTLTPTVQDGAAIFPRFEARFAHLVAPSEENGYLGATVVASYSYHSPDTFFYRQVPLEDFAGEVVSRLFGAPDDLPVAGSVRNFDQGRLGIRSQLRDLRDQDRVARFGLLESNQLIQHFESCQETITGEVVGDRDGKFRFFVGQGLRYAPPGYEDDITGELNTRNLWFDLVFSLSGVRPGYSDDIVDPESTSVTSSGVVTGRAMSPDQQGLYLSRQKDLLANEIDDEALVGLGRPALGIGQGSPFPRYRVSGQYRFLWEPSTLSRLFPERAKVFTTLGPGLGYAPELGEKGIYTYLRVVPTEEGSRLSSTFNQTIGSISNPALGDIPNVQAVSPQQRLPRARVWRYYPQGSAELDAALGTDTLGKATVLATPLPLTHFPIDAGTGLPDVSALSSNGGDLADLVTGDPALSNPSWVGSAFPVSLGRPSGTVHGITNVSGVKPRSVFVVEIQQGCVLILGDSPGNPLSGDDLEEVGGGTLHFSPGDTLFAAPDVRKDTDTFSDPPTTEELQAYTESLPQYRVGFDLGLSAKEGKYLDISYPSIRDPLFPVQEVVGQNPPEPLSAIQGVVDFTNVSDTPFNFPALQGEFLDDSGDFALPYLQTPLSEVSLLGEAGVGSLALLRTENASGTGKVWPDETRSGDGTLVDASLQTTEDLSDAREYDLLLVERDQGALPDASQGILSVGSLTSDSVEVPRFVTETRRGSVIKYILENAYAFIGGGGSNGMALWDNLVGPNRMLTLDVFGTGLPFGDGGVSSSGGIGHILLPGNRLLVRLYDPATGSLLETITIVVGGDLEGDLGSSPILNLSYDAVQIQVETATSVVQTLGSRFDYTISIDTYNGGAGAGSTTARVESDRLTFSERINLSSMQERGTVTMDGEDISAKLSVFEVTTASTTASTVNAPAEVNGGEPFTFLARSSVGAVGSFIPASSPGAGDEIGSCKVMSWEGHGNVAFDPVPTGVRFALTPSSSEDGISTLMSGQGPFILPNICAGSFSGGAEAGDLMVVKQGPGGEGCVYAGTYVIRHVVRGSGARSMRVVAGQKGWATFRFPRIVSTNGTDTLIVDSLDEGWASTGRVFVGIEGAPAGIVSMAYNSWSNTTFTLSPGSAEDAEGNSVPDAVFFDRVSVGQRVSGMSRARTGRFPNLPTNNVAGDPSVGVGGFEHITLINPDLGIPVSFNPVASPSPGEIGVTVASKANPTVFHLDPETVVYDNVPVWLDIDQVTPAQWEDIHGPDTGGVTCILPGDVLVSNSSVDAEGFADGTPGFTPLYGVYVEPSVPRSCRTLLGVTRRQLVDESSVGSLEPSTDDVGTRLATDYGALLTEQAVFEVRRIRRWSRKLNEVGVAFEGLRKLYETRRGVVGSYYGLTLTASTPTQFGSFLEAGVSPGDTLVLGDEAAEISRVLEDSLELRAPGLGTPPTPGDVFHILLRQHPVPLEQAHDQLVDVVFEEVLLREAIPNSQGGRVGARNELRDQDTSFDLSEVAEGDFLVVDPQGTLAGPGGPLIPPERGSRPFGDLSVPGRSQHLTGSPSETDDNRGAYRVLSVSSDMLEVTGTSPFAGTEASPVTFGSPGSTEYAVLPLVTDGQGGLPEGQNDLRITAPADGSGSYQGNLFSVEPFSYRILRSRGLLETASEDLILFMRERMLSWMEALRPLLEGEKSGSYYDFQRLGHMRDLGTVTAIDDGLGLLSDPLIESLQGLVDTAPFESTSDCLSLLDRRFWVLDQRLDRETPGSSSTPYADLASGEGRPVLVDLLQEPLNIRERLRDRRYSWINLRTNRVSGTLPSVQRLEDSLDDLLEEERQKALLRGQ